MKYISIQVFFILNGVNPIMEAFFHLNFSIDCLEVFLLLTYSFLKKSNQSLLVSVVFTAFSMYQNLFIIVFLTF